MFWYLASPYSKYPEGTQAAFEMACGQAGLLIRAGVPVFSPIAHSHPISEHGGINPLDHDIWLPADKPFMDAARGCIVVMADGWQESYGVKFEIDTFYHAGKPFVFMQPGVVPAAVLR